MVCASDDLVHDVHVFRDAILLLDHLVVVLLGHPIYEVDMAEVPTYRLWLQGRRLHHLLHHRRPAVVLLGDDYLIRVEDGNVLEPLAMFET